MKRHQQAGIAKSVPARGLALVLKTAGIVAWGVSTTLVLAVSTALCVLLLFAPPFVFMLPLCARGVAIAATAFRRALAAVGSEWRALGSRPAGPSGRHAFQGS